MHIRVIFITTWRTHFIDNRIICSKWQTKEDQPVVVEEDLAAVEGAVGVVPGGVGEESPRTKMYAPVIIKLIYH